MFYATFTSESVCAGHPDKICDQISDAILDAALEQDPHARVAVEAIVKDRIIIVGELTATAKLDLEALARAEVQRLGYTSPSWGFHSASPVEVHVNQQSSDIAQGVDQLGAGDQGMMFGFACNETDQCMPMPIVLAHGIVRRMDRVREEGALDYLRPDGKAQVTVRYQNGVPVQVVKVVVAVPHAEHVSLEDVAHDVYEHIVASVLAQYGFHISSNQLIVNGTGAWHVPGPIADAGLTGRKIVVDGYGGYARVGGGAFSGKDPSKVDRSGAYAARYLAKNIVASGMAERCEVALAYAIGRPQPVMQAINTFDSETTSIAKIESFAQGLLDTSVSGIIDGLDLRQPIYKQTAAYGHFGRPGLPWERVVQ